ncbi:MAG: hypothetical protein J6T15_07005 [Bacilli bacterium]|nr:hypothetical protein [Bacilli bacterium]
MNKKSICLAIANLLCLGGITSCSCSENSRVKENGKKKRDYDTSFNAELAAYLGQEITYNGVHFGLEQYPEKENYFKLKVFSTNDKIKSYDVVEAYTCDLNGKLWSDYIVSPITFSLKTNEVAYYDLGFIYIDEFYRGDDEDDYSDAKELRIIGQNVNITFHMWKNDALTGNGKTVDDYICTKNIVKNAHLSERLKFNVMNDGEITFEAFHVDKPYLNNTFCIQGVSWKKYNVDIVEVYATDINDENRVDLIDKPSTMNFDKSIPNVVFCLNDIPLEFRNLYIGYVRYHIVTNYFTAIFQNYDFLINGKTVDDYDLSSLQEIDFYCTNYKSYKDGHYAFIILGDYDDKYPYVYGYIDDKKRIMGFKFEGVNRANVDSIDIIKTYFSDKNGDNIEEYVSIPLTLHQYYDGNDGGMRDCQFRVPIDDRFKEYYALCKNEPYFTLVTNLGIIKMSLVEDQIKENIYQPGDFIDVSANELSTYKEMTPVTAYYGIATFENGRKISIQQEGIFGLPYKYSLTFINRESFSNSSLTIFDAYFTDGNGKNKVQVFDKAYRIVFGNSGSRIVDFLAPEYSYFLNANENVVLHLVTNWGTAEFPLS